MNRRLVRAFFVGGAVGFAIVARQMAYHQATATVSSGSGSPGAGTPAEFVVPLWTWLALVAALACIGAALILRGGAPVPKRAQALAALAPALVLASWGPALHWVDVFGAATALRVFSGDILLWLVPIGSALGIASLALALRTAAADRANVAQ